MAKVLYVRGAAACQSTRDKQTFAIGLLSLHDGVELALGALGDHVRAVLPDRIGFMQYFDLIDAKIAPDKLPYRREIDGLNSLRVNTKHRGILPDVESSRHFPSVVMNFLTDVCDKHMGVDFARVSLRDAIKDDNARGLLSAAEDGITQGEYKLALEFMGYAWFRGFEQRYVFGLGLLGQESAEIQFPQAKPAQIRFDLIEKGIDQFLYFRFKNLVPKIGLRKDTGALVAEWERAYGHPKNWTEQNARFAYDFVVDALIKALTEPDAGYTLVHYVEAYFDKLEPVSEEVIFYENGYPPSLADSPGTLRTLVTGMVPLGTPALTLRSGEYVLGWANRSEDKPAYFVHLPVARFYYVHSDEVRLTPVAREDAEQVGDDGQFRLKTPDC
jgi:hypothetical protein